MLVDSRGRKIYDGGVTHDDIRDAIQAAARADDYKLAYEIAERYGWNNVCLRCAEAAATDKFWPALAARHHWPICKSCKEILDPSVTALSFSDVKLYTHGVIKRNIV